MNAMRDILLIWVISILKIDQWAIFKQETAHFPIVLLFFRGEVWKESFLVEQYAIIKNEMNAMSDKLLTSSLKIDQSAIFE